MNKRININFLNALYLLSPYINFYGNSHYIGEVTAYFHSFSSRGNCLTGHIAAPQLILEFR
jgi:hypothetical protein